jgi:hypothetical protein
MRDDPLANFNERLDALCEPRRAPDALFRQFMASRVEPEPERELVRRPLPKPQLVAVDGAMIWPGHDVEVIVSEADPNWPLARGRVISIVRAPDLQR